MRFVIGLLSGAAAILILAQLGGVGDASWRDRLADGFDALAGAAGEALALPPRPPTPTPPPETAPARLTVADPDEAERWPAREPIPRPPDTPPPDAVEPDPAAAAAVLDPGAAQRPPVLADGPAPGAEDVERIVAEVFGLASAPNPDPVPEPDPVVEPAAAPFAAPAPTLPTGLQPVWVPFHSRMSARGFAEQLSASLDHPFEVERRGPGRYQVVFGYRDEPQRQALLAQAAALTGLEL